MNIKKTTIKTETACERRLSESLVEGRLTLPSQKTEMDRVLFVQGRIQVNAEPIDGKVFMDGTVTFSVVYIGIDGSVDAFEATSPFRHSEEMEGAGAGMLLMARGSVKDIGFSLEDARTVSVKGIVSVDLRCSMTKNLEAVTDSEQDIQMKPSQMKLTLTKNQMRESAAIRGDIRLPQSLPMAEKVLNADAYAVVRSVHTEELKIVVEGDIRLSVLYLSADKNAPLQQFTESVPFGQIIAAEGLSADDNVSADVSLADMNVSVAEEAGDIMRLSGKLQIVCSVRTDTEITYMEDAYSLKNRLNIRYEDQPCRRLVLSGCTKAIARSTIAVPPSEPAVSRVICLKAWPSIASVQPGTDRVYIEGLMMFTLCYASAEGLCSFAGETPFEAEVQMDGITANQQVDVSADVEYCSFDGTGRDISVKFMMDVEVRAFEEGRMRLVSDISESDEPMIRKQGITIYFADGGETVWDVAKRYATTLDSVKRFNPEMGDTLQPGQKIVIMS